WPRRFQAVRPFLCARSHHRNVAEQNWKAAIMRNWIVTTTLRAARLSAYGALALGLGLALVQASAQTARYPDRPIKILVGFAAGGGTDVAARILAQKLTENLGQSVLVENRPGASGMIAADAVAKSAADGYTLMMGSQTTLAVAPALYRKFALDAARDFAGVSAAGVSPLVLVVHPSVPAPSVQDLIALAKASPCTIKFGLGGLGKSP